MPSDVIDDATVEYIIASEQLDLAFRVEEAMPIVRKRLVEKVVRDVEDGFSNSDLRVVSTDYSDVMEKHCSLIVLRKNGWYEHGNKDPRTGIHLSSYGNFFRPYICLHLDESYIDKKGEYIVERFKEFETYEHAPTDGRSLKDRLLEGIMWKDVPYSDEFGDWGSENFFKRAVNSEKRGEIVKRFICMIDGMAAEIGPTMEKLG